MNGAFLSEDWQNLAQLFGTAQSRQPTGAENPATRAMLHPGTIAAQQQGKQKTTAASAKAPSKDIWADDEVMESEAVLVADADLDTRQRPEFDVKYRQRIGAEDVYLGLGGKLPGVAHSDDLVVEVHLPASERSSLQLNVTATTLDLRTDNYRLTHPLPNRVDEKHGQALWDSSASILRIVLPVVHDL